MFGILMRKWCQDLRAGIKRVHIHIPSMILSTVDDEAEFEKLWMDDLPTKSEVMNDLMRAETEYHQLQTGASVMVRDLRIRNHWDIKR